MITRLGVVGFGELADQFFEDVAHVMVADHLRVQVDSGELLDDQIQPVGLGEVANEVGHAKAVEDITHVGREPLDVVDQVVSHPLGIAHQGRERPPRRVVERQLELGFKHDGGVDLARLNLFVLGKHLVLGRFEDAVQAAQDGERQNHVAVLVGLIRPPQQVGDLPDQIRVGLRHVLDLLPTSDSETPGSYLAPKSTGRVCLARCAGWRPRTHSIDD